MKTLHEMIKDLTGVTVENWKIREYLRIEVLDLQDAFLNGPNLTRTVLAGANLQWANLWGADLRWDVLKDADLQGVNLSIWCLFKKY
ncbi:hypothetical protein C6B38_06050 [Spiroplasma sp. ChiS]|uniref:pentapeptide repeat-containing protein n=1 Tax=Spiroplasma sp. ChiS TaxID=2099885 RepID=UPI000CF933E2|nr:pentapeptide repeat-containing protein [Spiroplasma sp. ChiS]PQP78125.1 hypothetical protein C6B38_08040 [Spiroplasma sp. ChiS]PQP78433.1 hypothetical protein C6B38_06050 [Spiroplasma sp. ChiS]